MARGRSTKKKLPLTQGAGAQLQLGIGSLDTSASPLSLELFLANTERHRQFTEYVTNCRPTHVFDLRTVPSFDSPHTSRRWVLESMRGAGVRYLDVMAMVNHEGSLAAHVIEFCVRNVHVDTSHRPVLFLFESIRDLIWSSSILPSALIRHTSRQWHMRCLGLEVDPSPYESALRHSYGNIPPVHSWMVGEVLHVATPVTIVVTSHYPYEAPEVQLPRGSSVRVLSTYSDFSADVLVLSGPVRGATVRLPLMSNFARVVR